LYDKGINVIENLGKFFFGEIGLFTPEEFDKIELELSFD
jgi:hypothetical protein